MKTLTICVQIIELDPWLYKEYDIRQRIESLRERQITSSVVSKSKKSSRSEEILIKTLKRRVMELEKENKNYRTKFKSYMEICIIKSKLIINL